MVGQGNKRTNKKAEGKVDPNVIARLITENPDVPPEQDG